MDFNNPFGHVLKCFAYYFIFVLCESPHGINYGMKRKKTISAYHQQVLVILVCCDLYNFEFSFSPASETVNYYGTRLFLGIAGISKTIIDQNQLFK